MLPEARSLVDELMTTRTKLIARLERLTPQNGQFRPAHGSWSAAEVVEHLVWAEHGGLKSMVVALEAWRRGEPVWTEPNPNRDLDIETIIANTWKPKEKAPTYAEPSWGGPLDYWLMVLRSNQSVAEGVASRIGEDELDDVVYPHFLSGPLTMRQRLAFLRFHMEHHMRQLDEISRALRT